MSGFDRWLTSPPEDRWFSPFETAADSEQPDPCPQCDCIGCHGPECPADPDPWTEYYLGPGIVENPARVVRSQHPARYAELLKRWER